MSLRRAFCLLPFLATTPLLHCDGDDPPAVVMPPTDGGTGAEGGGGGGTVEEADKPLVPATKVDLLFAVDNSQSMGDKQTLLGSAVSRILRRLAEPSADHGPVDLHIGVVTSSLGTYGALGACDARNRQNNENGHLNNDDPLTGKVLPGLEAGFLSFAPGGDIAKLEADAKSLIVAAGQNGCGLEAQLESLYRFLIQPDPPSSIEYDEASKQLKFGPIDDALLAQRKAFLRPDSAVAIVMLTDEDDSNVDPSWNRGQGWAFTSRQFPGSKVARGTPAQGTTAPRGTKICETDPSSVECVSCADCNADPACKAKQDPNCSKSPVDGQAGEGFDGYSAPADDEINVRFFHMKQRFGVDPQFPIDRYRRGLSYRKVPRRETEHDAAGKYVHAETCTNPLFAAQLPSSSKEEYCQLPEGTRSRRLVMFQLIGGLPPALAGASPNWTAILGQDPDRYDYSGIDPHMIQSNVPRPQITGGDPITSKRGDNGTDPVHGRDWDTRGRDLEYACTVALPVERACAGNSDSCECADDPAQAGKPQSNTPLCATDGSATQIRAKAYPTIRELRLVKALGDRGLVASICSVDPASGYGPILENLATKLSTVLAK